MSENEHYSPSRLQNSQSRLSSVSAIPRPTSGTSRRATPLSRMPINDATTRNSVLTKDEHPPSAFKASRRYTQGSEPILSSSQRQAQHVPGLKHYSDLKHSPQGLKSPVQIRSPRQTSWESGIQKLTKSKTSATLTSPHHQVQPTRQLMRPLDPPLPRSQTIGNIPSYGAIKSPVQRNSTDSDSSHVNVVDVLRESRMTEQEITSLNLAGKELATNTSRVDAINTSRQLDEKSKALIPISTSFSRKPTDAATVTLSLNDTVNMDRLEEQRKVMVSGRPLFINTSIPAVLSSSAVNTPTTRTSSQTISSAEDEWEENIKHVHFAEPSQYWTGRYMSFLDRLRNQELSSLDAHTDMSDKQMSYDAQEHVRVKTALDELRSCCRTRQALESYIKFEFQLLKSYGGREGLLRRIELGNARRMAESRQSLLQVFRPKKVSELQEDSDTSSIASINALIQSSRRVSSGTSYAKPLMTKSKTISNFVTAQAPASTGTSTVNANAGHSRRPSYLQFSPDSMTRAIREREERALRRVSETTRRVSSSRHVSSGSIGSIIHNLPKKPIPHNDSLASLSGQCLNQTACDKVLSNTTYAAFERGHDMAPPKPPTAIQTSADRPLVEMVNDEKVSRNKKGRQSSAEVVKTVLRPCIREVRKMSRRVAGMKSWSMSAEDLAILRDDLRRND